MSGTHLHDLQQEDLDYNKCWGRRIQRRTDVIHQVIRVRGMELMGQVTQGVDHLQIRDMHIGRVANSNLTAVIERPMTGGLGVPVKMTRVSVLALYVPRVVVGDRDHWRPTVMVWMANSNYWMGLMSTRTGMTRLR